MSVRPRTERAPPQRRAFERNQAERTQPPGRGRARNRTRPLPSRPGGPSGCGAHPPEAKGCGASRRRLRRSAATGIDCAVSRQVTGQAPRPRHPQPDRRTPASAQGAPTTDDAPPRAPRTSTPMGMPARGRPSVDTRTLDDPSARPHDHGRDHGGRVDGFDEGRGDDNPSPTPRATVRPFAETRSAVAERVRETSGREDAAAGTRAEPLDEHDHLGGVPVDRPAGGQSHPRRRGAAPRAGRLRRGSAAMGMVALFLAT